MNLSIIKEGAKAGWEIAKRFVNRNSAELLLGAGVGAVLYGTVDACHETYKLPEKKAEKEAAIEEFKKENPDADAGVITKMHIRKNLELARGYIWPATFIVGGVCCIGGSYGVMNQRVLERTLAYNSLLATFNSYRGRVVENEGEAQDILYMTGAEEIELETETTTKTGKIRKRKVKALLPDADGETVYLRYFNSKTSELYAPDQNSWNEFLVRHTFETKNNQLKTGRTVTIDEICDSIRIPLKFPESKILGWRYDPDWDEEELGPKVAYRIIDERDMDPNCKGEIVHDMYGITHRKFGFWIEFLNVDGMVLDDIH